MKVFLVGGGTPSWRNSGWGHALKDGGAASILVSFLEVREQESVAFRFISPTYQPKPKEDGNEQQ